MKQCKENYMKSLSVAVSNVFETLAFSEVLDSRTIDELPDWTKDAIGATINIIKPVGMKYTFMINKKYAEFISEAISGFEESNPEEGYYDLVAELTNSIAGAFAVNINSEEKPIELGLPKPLKNWNENGNSDKTLNLLYNIEDYEIICRLESLKDECSSEMVLDFKKEKNESVEVLKDCRILIVDDSDTERLRLKKILKKYGCKIIEAKDGDESLDILANDRPDLILLDVMMPGRNGFETCEIIKSNPETSQIPVIFVTSMKENQYKIKGFNLGAVDYIAKPYYAEEVLARVKTQIKLVAALKTIKEYNAHLEDKLEERTRNLIKSEREAVFGQMVQGIVHNMRNPLTGILGAANLIKMDLGRKCKNRKIPDLIKKVEIIEKSSRNLDQMMHSLMQKSRSDHTEEFEYFDLNEIICQEMDFLDADQFYKHNVDKKLELSNNLAKTYAVPSMISQVFQNLIRNALDAMHETKNPELEILTSIEKEYVSFSIKDNGPGIPEENIERIFDPFFTTKPKNKPENGSGPVGTGLGLYICSEMLKVNNGKIEVKNNAEGGATFKVSLPASK